MGRGFDSRHLHHFHTLVRTRQFPSRRHWYCGFSGFTRLVTCDNSRPVLTRFAGNVCQYVYQRFLVGEIADGFAQGQQIHVRVKQRP